MCDETDYCWMLSNIIVEDVLFYFTDNISCCRENICSEAKLSGALTWRSWVHPKTKIYRDFKNCDLDFHVMRIWPGDHHKVFGDVWISSLKRFKVEILACMQVSTGTWKLFIVVVLYELSIQVCILNFTLTLKM